MCALQSSQETEDKSLELEGVRAELMVSGGEEIM